MAFDKTQSLPTWLGKVTTRGCRRYHERTLGEGCLHLFTLKNTNCETRDKVWPEEITREIPNVGEDASKTLTKMGIIRIGAEVKEGDILVGKVTPKGRKIFQLKNVSCTPSWRQSREVRDTSLRVPRCRWCRSWCCDLYTCKWRWVATRCYHVGSCLHRQKRKTVGDKRRTSRKQRVVSRIVPVEDMPYFQTELQVDIMLNHWGAITYEYRSSYGAHLVWHCTLGIHIATPALMASSKDLINC